MLFHKITNQYRLGEREIIGLIGTHHGVGVTHTGLMLAFYLGEELGRRTAFVECNDHHDMKRIFKAYEWQQDEEGSFFYHRITCYEEVRPGRIAEVLGEAYQCVVLDFGTDYMANRDEFMRCSTKIVVGGRSQWDIQKLDEFMNRTKTCLQREDWRFVIPQASSKRAVKLGRETGYKVWALPLNDEPTMPGTAVNRFFREMLY